MLLVLALILFYSITMAIADSDYEGPDIKALGSLFKVTQIFLWLVVLLLLFTLYYSSLLLSLLHLPYCPFHRDDGLQVPPSAERSVSLSFPASLFTIRLFIITIFNFARFLAYYQKLDEPHNSDPVPGKCFSFFLS